MRCNEKRSSLIDRCVFHNDIGHRIKEYTNMKDAIEEVIRDGELVEYVDQATPQQDRARVTTLKTNKRLEVIYTEKEYSSRQKI